jgi:acetoin utilization deacetylase AcuC-like enzyme
MTTAIVYDPRYLDHDTGFGHPERPDRLAAAIERLRSQTWYDGLLKLEPRAAADEWVDAVHDGRYRERALAACAAGVPYLDSPDVAVSDSSGQVALLAAGGVLAIADAVMDGRAGNGFALVRPPGHHAERGLALGFCLFNNVAIGARYLQRRHGLERILILDWDVHHGNGTQHLFEADPSVFYVSLHQYPHYPGTGSRSETGSGAGRGATLNCPMSAGSGDADYEQAFVAAILPAVESFRPDAVLLSAGFDAHCRDPLGAIELSTGFYGWMTERALEIADRHAGGRLISVLEGGYDLAALADSVTLHVSTLAGAPRDSGTGSR